MSDPLLKDSAELLESIAGSVAKLENACSLLTIISIRGKGQNAAPNTASGSKSARDESHEEPSPTHSQANIRQLEGLLALAEDASRRKQAQLDEMKKELRMEEDKSLSLSEELEKAHQRVEEAEQASEASLRQLDEARMELAELQETFASKAEEFSMSWTSEVKDLKKAIETKDLELSAMESEKAKLENEVGIQEQRCQDLSEELDQLTKIMEELKSGAEGTKAMTEEQWALKLSESAASHKKRLEELYSLNEAATQQLELAFSSERDVLMSRVASLEKQLEESKDEIAEAEAKVADYEQALDELEREQKLELERMAMESERKLMAANAKSMGQNLKGEFAALHSKLDGSGKPGGYDDEQAEVVTSMSRVIAQKTAEIESFKESTDDTVIKLNEIIMTKDEENGKLRQTNNLFILHTIKVQCRYCGRQLDSRAALQHVPRCMERRGVGRWQIVPDVPPDLEWRATVKSFETVQIEGSKKTVYVLQVQRGDLSYVVKRRYREVNKLSTQLKQRLTRVKLPELTQIKSTPANLFSMTKDHLAIKRSEHIGAYLGQLLRISAVVETPEMSAFLELDEHLQLKPTDNVSRRESS